MRLFVAVELDGEVLDRIEALVRDLREVLPEVRWARREGLHVTLKFLGEVDDSRVPSLSRTLEGAAAAQPGGIRLEVEGLGTFGDKRRPRVVWAGVQERSGALVSLHEAVEAAALSEGFEREGRPFRPHLTLARLKRSHPGLGRALATRAGMSFGSSAVSAVTLMESRLAPEGAAYSAVGRFALGPAPGGPGS